MTERSPGGPKIRRTEINERFGMKFSDTPRNGVENLRHGPRRRVSGIVRESLDTIASRTGGPTSGIFRYRRRGMGCPLHRRSRAKGTKNSSAFLSLFTFFLIVSFFFFLFWAFGLLFSCLCFVIIQ